MLTSLSALWLAGIVLVTIGFTIAFGFASGFVTLGLGVVFLVLTLCIEDMSF